MKRNFGGWKSQGNAFNKALPQSRQIHGFNGRYTSAIMHLALPPPLVSMVSREVWIMGLYFSSSLIWCGLREMEGLAGHYDEFFSLHILHLQHISCKMIHLVQADFNDTPYLNSGLFQSQDFALLCQE